MTLFSVIKEVEINAWFISEKLNLKVADSRFRQLPVYMQLSSE